MFCSAHHRTCIFLNFGEGSINKSSKPMNKFCYISFSYIKIFSHHLIIQLFLIESLHNDKSSQSSRPMNKFDYIHSNQDNLRSDEAYGGIQEAILKELGRLS